MCNISLKITHKISLENIYKILIIVKLKNIDSENFYFRNFFIKYRVYPKIKSSNNQRIKINKKICHSFDEKEEQILSLK